MLVRAAMASMLAPLKPREANSAVAAATIRARFASDYAHRLTPEVVECDAPDTGRLVVPAPLLDAVMNGTWSCGSCIVYHQVTRYRSTRVQAGATPVDVEVAATVPLPL